MHPILALTLASMQVDMSRVDRAASNLANAHTNGYRRELGAMVPFAQLLRDENPGASAAIVQLDPRQGSLQATGQSLDLALSGPGWFEVTTPQGLAYTRAGQFRRDAQGRLVTSQGHAVMGISGEIQLPEGRVVIDGEGRIFEGVGGDSGAARVSAEPVAHLKVVAPEPGAPVRRLGPGLVAFGASAQQVDASTEVRQGYLENANVSPMDEMVQLMEAVRHLESLQKVALGYDEMLAGAIRQLGAGQ